MNMLDIKATSLLPDIPQDKIILSPSGYPYPRVVRFSNSSSDLFDACRKKFMFSKLFTYNRAPKELPAEVGHALHVGYQSYLQAIHREDMNEEQAREHALFKMMLRYPINLNSNPTNARSLEACYATLSKIIDYSEFRKYEIAEVKDKNGLVRPAIEVPFKITLAGASLSDDWHIPVIYVGFIDLILFDQFTGEYIVVDIKTTRWQVQNAIAKYANLEQCLPYALVLERMLKTDVKALSMTYLEVYVDIETPTIFPYSFHKSYDDIIDWARGVLDRVELLKRSYETGWFKKNGNACLSFNTVCSFFDICPVRDPRKIQQLLDYSFDHIPERDEFDFDKNAWVEMDLEVVG